MDNCSRYLKCYILNSDIFLILIHKCIESNNLIYCSGFNSPPKHFPMMNFVLKGLKEYIYN